jgi:sulfur carrier protein
MTIRLNGEIYPLQAGVNTVAKLLECLELSGRIVVVEHNRRILSPEDYTGAVLRDGDVVEIVHFVGGG